ncbi:MAG: FtsW/RodA/SpoVE family cell cycle protein [Candidatus Shapirobacteria bacterium]|nr:FtsW/RodA/SpoVE family cell cycle protein [Candidatus Shapirobacteria bacterium]
MTFRHFLPVAISLAVLFCLNLLMISSLSPGLLVKQLIAWIIGIILFFVGRQIDPNTVKSSRTLIFVGSCFLVLLPIILNTITRGSRRWIDFGIGTIQPSEIIKPWLLLFLVNTKRTWLIAIPVIITLIQPDLGSALTILCLIIPFILYHRRSLKFAVILALCLLILSPLIWKFALHDYQRHRIETFINPSLDPMGNGYNVIQSKIAIGSGGLFGKGYRKGTQGQLLFLPEKHTDFIFAGITEELGILGALLIIGSYGILPVTGIPLPFLSVGGSSIIALLFSLGIIYSS